MTDVDNLIPTDEHTAHADELTYCAVHPERETSLRCNRCGRYMCVQCAVRTPVGYRCRECVRGIEDKYFTAATTDYGIVFAACAVLNAVAAYLVASIGFLLFVLLLAAPAGGGIAEVALRLTGRRRGRYSGYAAAAGAAIGGLAPLIYVFLVTGRLIPNISLLLYVAIATLAVYGRFTMRV